ncbi:MAG TPA: FtsX-like permease family protein [Gammaproteobacteria bacterium]|nr:FtsX-like permease family protein [Gammaproteobacteria bacterium]
MKALDRKLWRDLWHMRGQALAIVLVIASGVGTYVMFLVTLDSLQDTRATFYRDNRFGQVFASLKRAPESLRGRLEDIPGVARVETRVVADVTVDIAGFTEPVTGHLVSIANGGGDGHALNRLYLRAGRLPQAGRQNEVVVGEAFAEAHRLQPGDHFRAVLNGRRQALTLVGTALSPEYIHQLRPGGLFPDYQRYGVMWMNREALAQAFGLDGAFNDVVLTLTAGTRPQDVIDRLDDLLERYGGLGAYERQDQRSHRFLSQEFDQLDTLANIFPGIFLGVAAFLLNVVVTRLVATQREQIAALKAFGYGNGAVTGHYLKLVAVVTAIGVALGLGLGWWLGGQLSAIYMEMFRFPYLLFELRPAVVLQAAFITAAAALAGTVFAVARAARLRPAQAMRPEPPARYRATLIERLGLRRWLSQPSRMILRHLARRPVKSLLSVVGIALALAIVMSGRFQQDTVNYMVKVQYGLSQRQDLSVTFTDPTAYRARAELLSLPGVTHVEGYRAVPVRFRHHHLSYRSLIRGMEPGGDIQRVLDADLRPITLPQAGVVLTDYLGRLLDLRPGDRLTVDVLEGARPTREVTVVGLAREYLGVSGYMSLDGLNRFMREGRALSGAYLAVDKPALPEIYRKLKDTPRIASVVVREREIANFNQTMQETMLFFTYVASVFAVVIAFGVVYNSARIALMERSRELASLRVLGFTRGEISYILLGELGLLTLAAVPLGMVMGWGLCALIAVNLDSDLYRVPLILEPATYAYSATVVLVAALISGLVVRRKLDRLDLIAVLKTRE